MEFLQKVTHSFIEKIKASFEGFPNTSKNGLAKICKADCRKNSILKNIKWA